MRANLVLLGLTLASCGAPAPPATIYDAVEQFSIATRACLPSWFSGARLDAVNLQATLFTVAQHDFSSPALAPFECVLAAGADCVEVRACYGLRSDPTAGPCNGAPPRCDGDASLACVPAMGLSPTQIARIDCAQQGLRCVSDESPDVPRVLCAVERCDTAEARCDGTAMLLCDGVFLTRQEAPPGTTCIITGGPHFVGAGAPCAEDACIEGRASTCDRSTGLLGTVTDCAALGMDCSTASTPHCVPRSTECTIDRPTTCLTGAILEYCRPDGRLRRYDCVAHGFAECEERSLELEFIDAHCAPLGPRF